MYIDDLFHMISSYICDWTSTVILLKCYVLLQQTPLVIYIEAKWSFAEYTNRAMMANMSRLVSNKP